MSYTVEVGGESNAETTVNQSNIATTTLMTRNLITKNTDANRIQIALLLDTSSSMSGLIEQAKSQLWKMVNELADSKKNGESPDIDIALYEYGNSTLAKRDGYIKQIVPMSTDLDAVSEKLFELTTNGGDEYCGQVVLLITKTLAKPPMKNASPSTPFSVVITTEVSAHNGATAQTALTVST